MKVAIMKLIKKGTAVLIALALISLSLLSSMAATLYYENGYYYSYLNNDEVEFAGYTRQTQTVVVPEKMNNRLVTTVANRAFIDDDYLTGIDFSNASYLSVIGMYSFANCSALNTKLTIPAPIEYIDTCAFEKCTSLPEVEITADLYAIPLQCFNGCSSLVHVTFNDGLHEILNYAFADCTDLEYAEIPQSVTYIAETAFQNTPNLTLGVWFGSYGYEYAQSHNIPYILLDSVLLGDANGDGYVNISDVTDIQRAVAEMDTLDDLRKKAADVNSDGVVTIDDATFLQTYLAEFETAYPIGEVV